MIFEQLPAMRRSLLLILKQEGPQTLARLAGRLRVTKEAVRQQLETLHAEGWVFRDKAPELKIRSGRPTVHFSLTPAGDHVFPKSYDDLASELLEVVGDKMGPAALRDVLAAFTDNRVKKWLPLLEGKSLEEKVRTLKDLYLTKDPFISAEKTSDGFKLIENNCPYLSVASHQPALCSVTVSTLTKLLGVKVIREERFQSGQGRCVFHIYAGDPVTGRKPAFQWEPNAPIPAKTRG